MERQGAMVEPPPDTASWGISRETTSHQEPVCNTARRYRSSGRDGGTEDAFGEHQGNSPLALAQSGERARGEVE